MNPLGQGFLLHIKNSIFLRNVYRNHILLPWTELNFVRARVPVLRYIYKKNNWGEGESFKSVE